jgi:hypothetical protein
MRKALASAYKVASRDTLVALRLALIKGCEVARVVGGMLFPDGYSGQSLALARMKGSILNAH